MAGRPRVVAQIASARTTQQLEQILPAATRELTPDELELATATSNNQATVEGST